MAFQIKDDLLDVSASAKDLGKTPGKDADADKLTYVRVHGLEAAQTAAQEWTDKAPTSTSKCSHSHARPESPIGCVTMALPTTLLGR